VVVHSALPDSLTAAVDTVLEPTALDHAPLPIIAFDGIQGADLRPGRDVQIALVYAPTDGALGTPEAQRAAALVVEGVNAGHDDLLATIRALGPFDDHGDPIDPPVYFRAL
jgi:hypothetical protein